MYTCFLLIEELQGYIFKTQERPAKLIINHHLKDATANSKIVFSYYFDFWLDMLLAVKFLKGCPITPDKGIKNTTQREVSH